MYRSSTVINRASLGQDVSLGHLYDARTDNFCGLSMFSKQVPAEAVTSHKTNRVYTEVFVDRSSLLKSKNFGISAELQLGIRSGMVGVDLVGSAGYVSETKSSRLALQAGLVYDLETECETLNLMSSDVKNSLSADLLRNHVTATHVVSEVHYGVRVLLSVAAQKADESDRRTLQTRAELKLVKIQKAIISLDCSKGLDASDDLFEISIYSDIALGRTPNSFDEAVDLMAKIPDLVARSGRGNPIRYTLFPLSDEAYRIHLGLPVPAPFGRVEPLGANVVASFVEIFDEIAESRAELLEYADYVRRYRLDVQLQRALASAQRDLNDMEASLRDNVRQAVVDARSGKTSTAALSDQYEPTRDRLMAFDEKFRGVVRKPEYGYEVIVQTGSRLFAGTNANVFVRLFGKYIDSGKLRVTAAQKKINSNQKDAFTVKAPLLLALTKLRIWHDNTGNDWFLDNVLVRDPRSGEEYAFPCGRWLTGSTDEAGSCQLFPIKTPFENETDERDAGFDFQEIGINDG